MLPPGHGAPGSHRSRPAGQPPQPLRGHPSPPPAVRRPRAGPCSGGRPASPAPPPDQTAASPARSTSTRLRDSPE
ncbi:hypothetical protein ACFFX0_13925 [Citricoccus parietis]|uniref:Uncharacterized protein n=1 Tax=Citricoccus parietis TaxID=592307 RepID=A0ABV5FZX4_9MICC